MTNYFSNSLKPWNLSLEEIFTILKTSKEGLTNSEANKRLKKYGINQIVKKEILPPVLRIFLNQFKNWFMLILVFTTLILFLLGEHFNSVIILFIIMGSAFLGFFQEYKAEKISQKLKKLISHKVMVKREGKWQEIESKNLVIGDIVKLQIGDLVPADIRLIQVDELLANESSLTGESFPVNKTTQPIKENSDHPAKITNMVFMGTHITGGYGIGVVTATGNYTFLGKTTFYLEKNDLETEFQKEIRKFSSFIFRVFLIMTILVFLVNSWFGKGIIDSFLFAIALGVGITPELLPVIITITLSQGALKMARKKVVVKRLISVEDLGNIDTLCFDKTGTLTKGVLSLIKYLNLNGVNDNQVLVKALVCTKNFIYGQNSFSTNPIDQALWKSDKVKTLKNKLSEYQPLDENEFDFKRRRMSVLVNYKQKNFLIVKGSPESILSITNLSSEKKEFFLKNVKNYEEKGFRVIAVGETQLDKKTSTKEDEKNLSLVGFLLFSDPLKPNIKKSIKLLQELGIKIKILSGDSLVVTKSIANQVGFKVDENKIFSGENFKILNKEKLEEAAWKYDFFARLTPEQKYQIVAFLNKKGHVVGFLGDGINDAPALKAADVGIAVDTGAPVAKEAADIILLEKDLGILALGIKAGRKTFGNIMKYIMNTISANFGNMTTVALASLFLKFIPLLPKQILLINFLTDIPLCAITTDKVDPQFTKKPKRWNIKMINNFMLYFGLISSIFDLLVILPIVFFWKLPAEILRTAWFIESSLSEMLITFVIRTKLPFYKSSPSKILILASLFSGGMVIILPLLALGEKLFDFVNLPFWLWLWIIFILIAYFILTEIGKRLFFKKFYL
ncbi:MAG: magnesium-translocating P-type ATPase [Microgenomates group bacterium]